MNEFNHSTLSTLSRSTKHSLPVTPINTEDKINCTLRKSPVFMSMMWNPVSMLQQCLTFPWQHYLLLWYHLSQHHLSQGQLLWHQLLWHHLSRPHLWQSHKPQRHWLWHHGLVVQSTSIMGQHYNLQCLQKLHCSYQPCFQSHHARHPDLPYHRNNNSSSIISCGAFITGVISPIVLLHQLSAATPLK